MIPMPGMQRCIHRRQLRDEARGKLRTAPPVKYLNLMTRLMTILAVVLLSVGCARTRVEAPTAPAPSGKYTVSGDPVTDDELYDALAGARVVLVAESHDSEQDHRVQLQILQAVAARGETGLGMEMFQRPFQPALDMFVGGEIDEDEMLQQTEWEERWGFETALYRPMWTFARDRGVPIVALNVRRELTKRIAKVGVAGLSDAERADLVELDLTNEKYRKWMQAVFRSHGAPMEDAKFEKFFAAQVAWDETMADTAAKWAQAHPDATLVVAVGRGHVERDWGIPSRLRKRLGAQAGDGTVISVVPVVTEKVPKWSWSKRNRFADYVWVH